MTQMPTEKAARVIANFCHIKGWAKPWADMDDEERNQFVGVVETLMNDKGPRPVSVKP